MSAHQPVPPFWNCGGCGAPWPCETRRRELRAAFADTPVSLDLHMRSHFASAAEDLAWVPAGRLRRRFLGWLG